MVNFSRKQPKNSTVFTLAPPILISKRSRIAQNAEEKGEREIEGREKKERGEKTDSTNALFHK